MRTFSLMTAAGLAVLLAGCEPTPPANTGTTATTTTAATGTTTETSTSTSKEKPGHGAHGAGPHEGAVADWGGGKYHVEFTVDHDKKEATVYILGDDEKTPAPIKADKIQLTIDDPSSQIELKAMPQEGETGGKSSRFVGTHDTLGIVREFSGTISGEVDGTPYTGDFKEEPHAAHEKKE